MQLSFKNPTETLKYLTSTDVNYQELKENSKKILEGLYLKSFSPDKVMVDERVSDFYSRLAEVRDIEPIMQTEFNFVEDDDNIPQISDEKAKQLIIDCIADFNGIYGKSGITKILAGSRSIENNEFHSKAFNSKYYGVLKGKRQKAITALIDELISNDTFVIKHTMYGRPILCLKN